MLVFVLQLLSIIFQVNKDNNVNKSLVTNISSVALIGIGYYSPFYSEQIITMGLYSFSGAITNWLAIFMLFEKVPFLYGSGIVTERFEEFKLGIKNLLMNQFFTEENISNFINQGESGPLTLDSEAIIQEIDFDKVFKKLKSAIIESPFGGMLNMFGGEQALEPLKPNFEEKFKELIKEMIHDDNFLKGAVGSNQGHSFLSESVLEMVNKRLGELTPKMVKNIIQEMIRTHLGWLVVWGGVFGALIGLGTTFL